MLNPSLASLPTFLSRWLGYRDPSQPLKNHKTWRICIWSFIGAWLGIAVLEIIGTYSPQLHEYHSPLVIASFGASAVLLYGSIDAPLSQPRNAFFGHIFGALVGVIINKLFTQVPTHWSSAEQQVIVQWVAGSTAVALAIVVMQLTVTVHPPGGATALIATVDDKVIAMGWYYIGVVAMSACIQIVMACLVNNIDRKYPSYWWRPASLPLKIDLGNLSTALPSPSSHHHHQHNKADGSSSPTHSQNEEEIVVDMDGDTATTHASIYEGNEPKSPINNNAILLDPTQPLHIPDNLLDANDIATLKAIHQKLTDLVAKSD
ncbi:HPP family-domain-containing protein [Absidia repens]|uniref:HPP family-domain-containing protein n=1 Tax=Absidia repens TaxID=90262 RepID=A0A1X2IN19_9FUNG|nr:HPP family-domain-containing protein [Absidia repens]